MEHEEKNEILAAIQQMDVRMNAEFASLRHQFSEQLDGVSDGFHLEMRALKTLIVEKAHESAVADEKLDSKIGLLGENIANVRTELARYHRAVEVPKEERLNTLEARVFKLEQKA